MSIVSEYRKKNDSYSKICVFRIGVNAGFFSEFNYLIFAILYCLENNIKLKLYSKDANFGYKDGWTDYFLPFTEEVSNSYHSLFNRHPTNSSLKDLLLSKNLGLLKWKLKNEVIIFLAKIFRFFIRKDKFDYYTHDLFTNMWNINQKEFKIKDIVDGNYVEAYNTIFDLLWRFNPSVSEKINELIQNLDLPNDYIACQIRGGDKIMEYDLLSVDMYLSEIKKISSLKNVFVLTDDYRIIKLLQSKAPDYNWYTLCKETERGYYNSAFTKSNPEMKRTQMISLFASVELLFRSSVFIGTITATPCCVVGIRRFPNTHWIDFDKNVFYDSVFDTIEHKNLLVREFLSKKHEIL